MRKILYLFFVLILTNCSSKENKNSFFLEVPMPTREEIPMDYLEKSLFLGWNKNDFSKFYYLKEFTSFESDYYTVKLLSQNVIDDKVEIIREYTSFYEDEEGFTYLEEFLEKKKDELKTSLQNLEIFLHNATFETKATLQKEDFEWSFKVNNRNVGNTKRFSTKVVVNKPDGTFKSILNHRQNKLTQYTDMKYLGFIMNPSKNNAVIVTCVKSEALEGTSLYSPLYIGCSLNDINGKQSSSITSNVPMKNGKRLIKESEIRGLLIGKWYLDAESLIGEPDKIYRSFPNSSRVYYNAVLDNLDGSVKHMCVFIVDDYVKEIFTCKPGSNLQLNGLNYISTSE